MPNGSMHSIHTNEYRHCWQPVIRVVRVKGCTNCDNHNCQLFVHSNNRLGFSFAHLLRTSRKSIVIAVSCWIVFNAAAVVASAVSNAKQISYANMIRAAIPHVHFPPAVTINASVQAHCIIASEWSLLAYSPV